ncbi:hypothetical protein [Algicella marina]|uniref:Calcium-binding protein n=1 Tax=Algicella marina TaxID=2683284 RepID=A0A6P1T0P9_9RHOB|nr:hypothetical protein [Algicella marina]QHQ34092.1 hypothetical protein GO499_02280 [Algicella marina]
MRTGVRRFLKAMCTCSLILLPMSATAKDVRNYIYGHSLINHVSDTPETTVPYWLAQLARAAGNTYAMEGQFHGHGFMQHVPPYNQWGLPGVQRADRGSFASSGYTHAMVTALNYAQYKPPTEPYDGDNPRGISPVSDIIEAVDWFNQQQPGIAVQIYVNWPDMAGTVGSFPPSAQGFAKYNSVTVGSFNDWFEALYSGVRNARPDANVSLIPAGPVMANLFTGLLKDVPVTDLYEDDAPHGKPTLYFLASLVTYVHLYGERPPQNFAIPASVNAKVRARYPDIREAVWQMRDKRTIAALPEASEPETDFADAVNGLPVMEFAGPGYKAEIFPLASPATQLADVDFSGRPAFTTVVDRLAWQDFTRPAFDGDSTVPHALRFVAPLEVRKGGDYVFF